MLYITKAQILWEKRWCAFRNRHSVKGIMGSLFTRECSNRNETSMLFCTVSLRRTDIRINVKNKNRDNVHIKHRDNFDFSLFMQKAKSVYSRSKRGRD